MHKSRFMSHAVPRKLNLPIVVEHFSVDGNWKPWNEPRSGGKFYFSPSPNARRRIQIPDAWALREEFLTWPVVDWKAFLDKTGQFGRFPIVSMAEEGFGEWQRLITEALLRAPREWPKLSSSFDRRKVQYLSRPLPFAFDWSAEPPVVRIEAISSMDAIIATIHLDHLADVRFRLCERPDCNKVFAIETQHKKKFCSSDCAHLEAVRRSRRGGKAK